MFGYCAIRPSSRALISVGSMYFVMKSFWYAVDARREGLVGPLGDAGGVEVAVGVGDAHRDVGGGEVRVGVAQRDDAAVVHVAEAGAGVAVGRACCRRSRRRRRPG